MARGNLSIIRESIEIRGYFSVYVNAVERRATAVKEVDGRWVTDIPRADMCGFIRIGATPAARAALVAQARSVIERAPAIRAEREANLARGTRLMTN